MYDFQTRICQRCFNDHSEGSPCKCDLCGETDDDLGVCDLCNRPMCGSCEATVDDEAEEAGVHACADCVRYAIDEVLMSEDGVTTIEFHEDDVQPDSSC